MLIECERCNDPTDANAAGHVADGCTVLSHWDCSVSISRGMTLTCSACARATISCCKHRQAVATWPAGLASVGSLHLRIYFDIRSLGLVRLAWRFGANSVVRARFLYAQWLARTTEVTPRRRALTDPRRPFLCSWSCSTSVAELWTIHTVPLGGGFSRGVKRLVP